MSRKTGLIEMLKLDPDDVFLHYALAMEEISENNPDAAILKLEWIRKTFPAYLAVYYQLGLLYEEKQQTDLAMEVYKAGFELANSTKEFKTASELRSALDLLNE